MAEEDKNRKSIVPYIVGLYFVLTITAILSLLVFSETPGIKYGGSILLFMTAVWYLAISAEKINADLKAGCLSLGKYTRDLEPGLNFVWHFFEEIIEVTKNVQESDIPESPEKIYHGDPNKPNKDGSPGPGITPDGMKPALRVNTAEQAPAMKDGVPVPMEVRSRLRNENGETPIKPGEKGMLLGYIQPDDSLLKPQTVEVEASYGSVVDTLQTFYETIGSLVDAKRNMDDHVISALSGRLQMYCLAESKLRKDDIEAEVKKDLETYCKSWGIKVTVFRLKPFGFSHDFNTKMSLAAGANEEAKTIVTLSRANATQITNLGVAEGNKERSLLTARADGFAKMAEVARTPEGQFAMANDTARAVAKEGTIVVPSDSIFGGILGVGKVLQMNQKPTPPVPPPTTPPEPEKPMQTQTAPAPQSTSSIILTDMHDKPKDPPIYRQKQNKKNRRN